MGKEAPGHAYDISRLNVYFALASIGLLIATLWMIGADYSREWKRYQRQFAQMERQTTEAALQQARQDVDQPTLQQLEQQVAEAQTTLAANQQTIDELEARRKDTSDRRILADIEEREIKSVYDSRKFYFEENLQHHPEKAKGESAEFEELGSRFFEAREKRVSLDFELTEIDRELREIRARRTEIEGERSSLTERVDLIGRKLETLEPSFANFFRNLPVVDFIDPSIEVKQVLVRNVTEDLNFTQVPRIDRCMTCHLGIDNPDYEEAAQPFRTHPRLDLFVNRESSHPMDDFGCTSCHSGKGRALDFSRATHTPRDEEQKAEWESKYGWKEDHYWDNPMYPADFSESGCLKCHSETVHIPEADDFNRGRDLYEKAGCWSCHNTKGFEERRKVGPNLDHLVSKTTPEWTARWVKDPRSFKPHSTFMPRFWDLGNNSDEEFGARNRTEVASIVAYVFDKAEALSYAPAPVGSPERGQELVESIGCLGCHIIEEEEAAEASWYRRHGPSLAGVGSKVNRDFLFAWLKNPKEYWSETFMPNLRLTDREAADTTAYLMTLTNEEFESLPVPEADAAELDEITVEFLRTGLPEQMAREELGSMSQEDKLLYSGEWLVRRYGCFACHDIKGFENAQRIGTDLSDWGSKMVTRLDFGFVDIEHTRQAYLEQKLRAPRSYDEGKIRSPQEKFRMPYFGFSEEQITDITRNVLGQVRDEMPLEATKNLDAGEAIAERARRFIHENNCRGCHLLDGLGGGIYETIENEGMRPPNLNTQGDRTKAEWLFHFLKEPSTVRFWLNARMPTFGFSDEQANTLVEGFMAMEGAQPFETKEKEYEPALLAEGDRLLVLLQCERCHIASAVGTMEASQLAPSFRTARERLREDWIVRWMADPQAIAPGTQMPQFWPMDEEGEFITPLPDILEGDPMMQMEAVASYIMRYTR